MLSLDAATDLMHLLGDGTRLRLLSVLLQRELSVAELTAVTELSQSRVSTHLGKLRDAGLVSDRRAGTSTFYHSDEAAMPAQHRSVWELLRGQLEDAVLKNDLDRAQRAAAAREQNARWYDLVAGQMERHYSPGRTWEATTRALPGLLRLGHVLDVGAGDGAVAEMLAARSRRYTCVDASTRMIAAAARRLKGLSQARCLCADMHALPFAPDSFDEVLLLNVLTFSEAPQRALDEVARVLRPSGLLSLVTLDAHTHGRVAETYHHVTLGFSPGAIGEMLAAAGLTVDHSAVTSRESRAPHFQVVTAFAHKR